MLSKVASKFQKFEFDNSWLRQILNYALHLVDGLETVEKTGYGNDQE